MYIRRSKSQSFEWHDKTNQNELKRCAPKKCLHLGDYRNQRHIRHK